jgi:hypothetical protein
MFIFSTTSPLVLGQASFLFSDMPRVLFLRVKRPVREVDHLAVVAKLKMSGFIPSFPPYASIACAR